MTGVPRTRECYPSLFIVVMTIIPTSSTHCLLPLHTNKWFALSGPHFLTHLLLITMDLSRGHRRLQQVLVCRRALFQPTNPVGLPWVQAAPRTSAAGPPRPGWRGRQRPSGHRTPVLPHDNVHPAPASLPVGCARWLWPGAASLVVRISHHSTRRDGPTGHSLQPKSPGLHREVPC